MNGRHIKYDLFAFPIALAAAILYFAFKSLFSLFIVAAIVFLILLVIKSFKGVAWHNQKISPFNGLMSHEKWGKLIRVAVIAALGGLAAYLVATTFFTDYFYKHILFSIAAISVILIVILIMRKLKDRGI